MLYNKLVRDKIPEIIKEKGGNPVIRIASDEKYPARLKDKLKEEVEEYDQSGAIEELADILEVINAICEYRNMDKDKLEEFRKNKAEKRGGFKNKIILEEAKD